MRLEAVLAAGQVPAEKSIEVVAAVVDRPMDFWITYALTQAAHHLLPHWLPAFRKGRIDFDGNSRQMAAVLDKVQSKQLLGSLKRLASSKDLDADARS